MLSVGTYMRRVSNKRKLIFEAILDCPGCTRTELGHVLGISLPLIYYHLARMDDSGYPFWDDLDGDWGTKRGLWPQECWEDYEFTPKLNKSA